LGFSCPQPFYFETAEGGEEKRLFFSLGSLVPHLPSTFQDSRRKKPVLFLNLPSKELFRRRGNFKKARIV